MHPPCRQILAMPMLPATQPSVSKHCMEHKAATNLNQRPVLILFSSTTGLLAEGALLPLHQLSDESISSVHVENGC